MKPSEGVQPRQVGKLVLIPRMIGYCYAKHLMKCSVECVKLAIAVIAKL